MKYKVYTSILLLIGKEGVLTSTAVHAFVYLNNSYTDSPIDFTGAVKSYCPSSQEIY